MKRDRNSPIAQGSVVCSVLEQLVVRHPDKHMRLNNLHDHYQHGFVRHKSTATQLAVIQQAWALALNRGKKVHCVYFDMKAVFDRVDHDILIQKMHRLGFHPDSVRWFSVYLEGRSFCVKVVNTLSSDFPARSGVPQGGCASPFLYSIFVHDVQKYLPPGVNYLEYAHDLKLYRVIDSSVDFQLLQCAVDSMVS